MLLGPSQMPCEVDGFSTWLVSLHFVWRWLDWLLHVCPLGPWRLIVSPLPLFYAYHFLRIRGGFGTLSPALDEWFALRHHGFLAWFEFGRTQRALEISRPREGKPSYLVFNAI